MGVYLVIGGFVLVYVVGGYVEFEEVLKMFS